MGDTHLVFPSLNLSILDAGNGATKFDDVLFEHGGLLHVLPLVVHLKFFGWTSTGDHSKIFLLFEFLCGIPPSCLKVKGWVVGGGWPTAF